MLRILNAIFLIPWNDLKPGMSFFIPCIDREQHIKVLQAQARRKKIKTICKAVIENNKYGLRMWVIE
jgi:hypothetical protein